MIVVRETEARIVMEGDEFVRIYSDSEKLQFSVASFLPGQRGPLDHGHENAHEVAFVLDGHFVMEFPKTGEFVELRPGDAVLIEEGEPHLPINVGEKIGTMSWSLAPNSTREPRHDATPPASST
jgi:mannose-6-phosphate isomerase-like protein (cupin superfamily)